MAQPWMMQLWHGGAHAERRQVALATAVDQMTREREAATATLQADGARWKGASLREIDGWVRARQNKAIQLRRQIDAAPPRWRLALEGSEAVLRVEQLRLQLAVAEQELVGLRAARKLVVSNGAALTAAADKDRQARDLKRAKAQCSAATKKRQDYENRWRWKWRSWWENAEHRRIVANQRAQCDTARSAEQTLKRLADAHKAADLTRYRMDEAYSRSITDAASAVRHADAGLRQDAQRATTEWKGSWRAKLRIWSAQVGLRALLWKAGVALLIITISPFLIRLFCYYGVAPIAMRRPAIRLNIPGGAGRAIPLTARSATSVGIRLEDDEELLVRQDYLQTSSHEGAKGTQWFLDWRHPITSIATGLSFLTRIRGVGQLTTVSAVRDPFAEVSVLTLPAGASCVLRPRALAAVAQPRGRPLRIVTHWRIASLSAWLTLQLRYVVFHGPARLVIKGGRGVRVELAEQGRIFEQDQLIGFSADLAYSVTRAETFWPYFLGRTSLFKDHIRAGEGVLVIEEAPLSAERGGHARRGMEGLMDAVMKLFGM
ncbi:hypothetical protein GGR44_001204 [Sphingobium fontiphilum]|uniref:Uncharacterized protein n=2 Tax=Sphingobium fontiphilum TaxID=944425 RepID=A0A7W6GNJ1_9SPHN|nr:hypothetical protein [Sphingobium fontiphilum]